MNIACYLNNSNELCASVLDARALARFRALAPDENGCLIWIGSVNKNGYGELRAGGIRMLAHRAAYAIKNGVAPAGYCICHRCDVRKCVNIDHLFVGSNHDNSQDMVSKGRQAVGVRHGSRTHPERFKKGDRPRARGERVNTAVLTESQVVDIRAKKAAGASCLSLANEYGVWPSNIGHIIHRRSWKHVP